MTPFCAVPSIHKALQKKSVDMYGSVFVVCTHMHTLSIMSLFYRCLVSSPARLEHSERQRPPGAPYSKIVFLDIDSWSDLALYLYPRCPGTTCGSFTCCFLIYFWGIWHAFPCQVRPGIMCLITCFEWSPPWHICWDILWRSIWHSTWHSMWHVFRHSIWHFLCNFIWHVFWPFISFYLTVSDIYFNLFWHSISHSVVIWHVDPLANSPHWPGCSNFKGDPVYPWKRPSVAIYKFEALANTYVINPKKSKPASNPSIYSRPATLQNWDTQVVWKTALAPNRPLYNWSQPKWFYHGGLFSIRFGVLSRFFGAPLFSFDYVVSDFVSV